MTRFAAPIAEQIWDMKYRLKEADGTSPRPERSRTPGGASPAPWPRSRTTRRPGSRGSTPRWRISATCPRAASPPGAGTARSVTLFNCFVMGTIPDSMAGIFEMLKEAALTMQQGGGIGYDFSTIRPKGAPVKGVAADASGPLSFMDVWDAMCRTIMSAGSRRGAMMATMRCDHPDIEDFITAKSDSARLRMFNLSVLVTDAFMEAVKADGPWELQFDGARSTTRCEARDLWNRIMRATYDYAEPGVIFIDRINAANNLSYARPSRPPTPAANSPCRPMAPACWVGQPRAAGDGPVRGGRTLDETRWTIWWPPRCG
jgi:ribonucleoside-diphosphate reductase alpha chain